MFSKAFLFYLALLSLSFAVNEGHQSSLRFLDEELEAPDERACEISQDDEEVSFKCETETGDEVSGTEIEDSIEYKVLVEDGLTVEVSYEQEIETNTTETETETSYTVRFVKVVEFSKADPNATAMAFDWETDSVVQTLVLESFSLSEIVADVRGIVSQFNATSPDGSVVFTFTISRAEFGGGKVSANKMKIDFELLNFPWTSTDTNVALICDIVSTQEIEIDSEDDESMDEMEEASSSKASKVRIDFRQAIETTGVTPFGEYTWDETAVVRTPPVDDNSTAVSRNSAEETISVVATSPADPLNASIAFSFIGDAAKSASDIYWDPEVGIGYDGVSTGGPSAASALTGFMACIVSVFSVFCLALMDV